VKQVMECGEDRVCNRAMKRKYRIIMLLVCALMLGGCKRQNTEEAVAETQNNNVLDAKGTMESKETFTQKEAYRKDLEELFQVTEDTHPEFILNDIPEQYEEKKQEILSAVTDETTDEEFAFMVQRYLTLLRDGHSRASNENFPSCVDVHCTAVGEHLYLLNEENEITADEVLAVEGVTVKELFEVVDEYFTAENEAAKDVNHTNWAVSKTILKLAGCDVTKEQMEVTLKCAEKTETKMMGFTNKNIYSCYDTLYDVTSKMIEDSIYYIDMNVCNVNAALDRQVKELQQVIDGGVKKIIIDVRDNPGGNSDAPLAFLEAMDMKAPSYGCFIRYSKLAKENYSSYPSTGSDNYEPDVSSAKKNPDIQLVVLTNENTYSSATMLASWVKDGHLGTVIGRTSSNAPSSYGDILYYTLTNSNITFTLSHKRFLRADQNADPKSVTPDIETDYSEDILSVAVEYLKSLE